MLIENSKIMNIVIESVNEIVSEWGIECEVPIVGETKIWGNGASFSSMNVVNLVVQIEDKIFDSYNVQMTIVDEKSFSQKNSPFRTVESLANYIIKLLLDIN